MVGAAVVFEGTAGLAGIPGACVDNVATAGPVVLTAALEAVFDSAGGR
jgi:hypothetical protein